MLHLLHCFLNSCHELVYVQSWEELDEELCDDLGVGENRLIFRAICSIFMGIKKHNNRTDRDVAWNVPHLKSLQ
jgi:hypothetical protein